MEKTRGSPSLVNRMVRAAKLDVDLYEEVEADTTATGQAFMAVLITSLAAGIGSGIAGAITGGVLWFIWGLFIGIFAAIIGWLIWSGLTYFIGTRLLAGPETSATYGELLRTIGFANSPGVIRILTFIPILAGLISFAAWVWTLIAAVIAVRQALDFSTWRAIGTCIVGWIVYAIIVIVPLSLIMAL